ncbi:MAG: carboxypeptidase-like regulatory domain-containing protein, partial [Bacteroidota bacterium]|nr:carboxypeptidase-like regulatory domain-containing protein [Bacteroidota bacterium]
MKHLTSISLLIIISLTSYGQVIKGTVYDSESKTPLPFTAVYFTGTLVGTSSDEDGEFKLDITEYAAKPLTIRAIGYQTFILDSLLDNKQYKIYLLPDLYEIEEVLVETKNLKKKRKAYLKLFRREFLGKSKNQRLCEIINEEDITFNYGLDKDTVKAFARKPIKIYNGALGYVITYHLDMFEYDKDRNVVSFKGDIVFNEDLAAKTISDQSYS